jgi:Ribbon-helix-helix protein, copG family
MSNNEQPKEGKKGNSIPTRFAAEELDFLDEIKGRTGLSRSDVIRRCVRFAGPRFLAGEINLLTLEVTP